MSSLRKALVAIVLVAAIAAGVIWFLTRIPAATLSDAEVNGPKATVAEADAQTIPTIGVAKPIGWKDGESPVAAQGLAVTRFADKLDHPRSLYTLPNGDVLVTETNSPPRKGGGIEGIVERWLMNAAGAGEPSPNKIVVLRDTNGDGKADQRFVMSNPALNSPFGLAWRDGRLYVANNDAVVSWPFQPGDTALNGAPEKLVDLPAGGEHWVRNLALSPDGTKLYISVGSSTNIADHGIDAEKGRAVIDEYDFATKAMREFGGGMRNPNGMAFNPATGELWTVVNERDMLGSDGPPDYLSNVPLGVQYGWPWVYWKNHFDDRVQAPPPDYLTGYVRKPEYALGAHTAPLGLTFVNGGALLGPDFANGAVIARHGSWNRRPLSGYDVVFVAFDAHGNALPNQPRPILTGFLEKGGHKAHGRPVWTGWAKDGALLVSDDVGGVIWRVVAPGAAPAAAIVPVKSDLVPKEPKLNGTIATPDYKSALYQPFKQ
ncbi:MAG: sorbosone dehydrogenase family protein [Sphingomonadales bacterium]|nr:sorbosone dehydrogenase family protein [Sphingomonadales bacterium]MDE2568306.1 sorbosone dehydrogenase family protein [Sphingomonadales bacterium]